MSGGVSLPPAKWQRKVAGPCPRCLPPACGRTGLEPPRALRGGLCRRGAVRPRPPGCAAAESLAELRAGCACRRVRPPRGRRWLRRVLGAAAGIRSAESGGGNQGQFAWPRGVVRLSTAPEVCWQELFPSLAKSSGSSPRDSVLLKMSGCRKRCKREILKFAQYLLRLITGSLHTGNGLFSLQLNCAA